MSGEILSLNAEPAIDSTSVPSEIIQEKDTITFGNILADPKDFAFRGLQNHIQQLERTGQIPPARTRAEEIARRKTIIQQVYEIERDEL